MQIEGESMTFVFRALPSIASMDVMADGVNCFASNVSSYYL